MTLLGRLGLSAQAAFFLICRAEGERQSMHRIVAIVLFALISTATQADIRVMAPGFIYNSALKDLATDYTKETGVTVEVTEAGMNVIVDQIRTTMPPADVMGLPADLMNTVYLGGGIVPDTYTPLGRDELGLAVKRGARHPDISTVETLATALKGASAVMVNDPRGGSMQATIIERILKRPEFVGVHVASPSKGEGAEALARGEGEMAIQLVPEILNKPQIELVGPLPVELGGHMDAILAVSSRSPNQKEAAELIKFLTRPEAKRVWRAKGMKPF